MVLLLILALFILLDLAAVLWGADSRDTVNNDEWRRMVEWRDSYGTGTKYDGK